MQPRVSLIASAVRPKLWESFFKSLEGTSVDAEVVFSGNIEPFTMVPQPLNNNFIYITTANIKPAQCYEIARRHATGETVVWSADDCDFPNDVIGKAYHYWKSQNNEKLILSIQTKESGYNFSKGQLCDMGIHRFFGACPAEPFNPFMAPIGLMSREFLQYLGGFDRRYVCGQYENDVVMRAYQNGGKVEIFGDKNTYIDIDHLGKSILIGESKEEKDFLNRPFAKGYQKDREVLENSWTKFNENKLIEILKSGRNQIYPNEVKEVMANQIDKFEPYEDIDILTKSQSNKGHWE